METENFRTVKVYKYPQTEESKAKMREYRKKYNEKNREAIAAHRRAKYHERKQEADALLATGDFEGADKLFYATALYSNKYKSKRSTLEDL